MSSLAVCGVAYAPSAAAGDLSPFRSSNLAPPVAIFGLPIWADVPEHTAFGFTTEVANHYRLSRRGDDQIIVDGETIRLRGYYERPFADGWSFGVDVPFFRQSGGFLDDLVDAWHSAFGLPDGARNYRREDMLEIALSDSGGDFYTLGESGTGLGDLQLEVARRLGAARRLTVRGAVKLPTGDERILAGSGAADWSVSLLTEREGAVRGRRAAYYVGLAVLDPGRPELVRFPIEDWSLNGLLGGALMLGERLGIKGQLEIYTPLYDTPLDEIGQTAVQATLGGWLAFGEGSRFEFAVSEDLHVSTAPDVALYFGLHFDTP